MLTLSRLRDTEGAPIGTIGITICYDLRFPELFRTLVDAGASVFTVPAAFTAVTGEAHWHTLLRSRAIETGCFVIAPAQCGEHPSGRKTYGHSLLVNPWGGIVAEASEEPEVLVTELDPGRIAEARQQIPSLKHDQSFDLSAPEASAVARRA